MADDPKSGGGNGDAGNRVAFDYIKSQNFRVVRADGAIGGVTPNGRIHFALYSERPAIPKRRVHELAEDGRIGKMIPEETVSRDSIVREMEVDVFLRINVARTLHEWLGDKIQEWDKLRSHMPEGNLE